MILNISPKLLLCLLIASGCQGTEVGNGYRKPETPNTDKADAPNSETPTAPDSLDPANEEGPTVSVFAGLRPLLVACASPFADAIAGSFLDNQGALSFSVAVASNADRILTVSAQTLTVTPAPSAEQPLAIVATAQSPALTCGGVSTETLVDSRVKKSLTLSDSVVLSWILSGGAVQSIQTVSGDTVTVWSKSAE